MVNQLIQNRLKTLLIVLFTVFISQTTANASETPYKPFVKGSFAQIQQQNKGQPYIIAFWSVTCAYCMKELTMLGQLVEQYPEVKLITISTDPFFEGGAVQQLLASKNLTETETWVFADNYVEKLYFDINPRWRGELPLTYFFDKNGVMLKHMGVVKEGELIEWLDEQSKLKD